VLIACVLLALPLAAQVEVRQATPDEAVKAERGPTAVPDIEVPGPMLLDISLDAGQGHRALRDLTQGQSWYATGLRRYVTDRARVEGVWVRATHVKKKARTFIFIPTITSGWYRQDIDLTLQVLDSTGKQVRRRVWTDMTIGSNKGLPFEGLTVRPEFKVSFNADEVAKLFPDAGQQPTFRIVLNTHAQED